MNRSSHNSGSNSGGGARVGNDHPHCTAHNEPAMKFEGSICLFFLKYSTVKCSVPNSLLLSLFTNLLIHSDFSEESWSESRKRVLEMQSI